jgi:hypothetical protein
VTDPQPKFIKIDTEDLTVRGIEQLKKILEERRRRKVVFVCADGKTKDVEIHQSIKSY